MEIKPPKEPRPDVKRPDPACFNGIPKSGLDLAKRRRLVYVRAWLVTA
jgi:hypothetical protein